MKAIYTEAIALDIEAVLSYFVEVRLQPLRANKFLDQFHETIARIKKSPTEFVKLVLGEKRVYRAVIPELPFAIYYQIEEAGSITFLRVLHKETMLSGI